ncbi:hypothetical protein GSI_03819 [Ganoderma sinense ZZ0214-1]|uniref:Uncharacterized protein n=1 Tax=Ganoderma sinense ZZ0214-1 TaxID=1077348 RepID=A0A2G8SKL3_9APHY|nr:hypothetical protein GSI_03819 [Ganoderma sinense ZZ0214-1]
MQAIVRAHLCTSSQDVTTSFMEAARNRVTKSTKATPLPAPSALLSETGESNAAWKPTPALKDLLRTSRTAYGAGMGLLGLTLLTGAVTATARSGWKPDDETACLLSDIDRDLCQAIVSSKQEMEAGKATKTDVVAVQTALLRALDRSKQALGEEYPFESGETEVRSWI